MNDPASAGPALAYFDAMRDADQVLADALGRLRAEEDAGRITPAQAAAERIGLLGATSPSASACAASCSATPPVNRDA